MSGGRRRGESARASYVCTARSVSNVNVLPLLTWNTYNFMLDLPEFSASTRLAHLVFGARAAGENTQMGSLCAYYGVLGVHVAVEAAMGT